MGRVEQCVCLWKFIAFNMGEITLNLTIWLELFDVDSRDLSLLIAFLTLDYFESSNEKVLVFTLERNPWKAFLTDINESNSSRISAIGGNNYFQSFRAVKHISVGPGPQISMGSKLYTE